MFTAVRSFARSGVIIFSTTWRSKEPIPVERAMKIRAIPPAASGNSSSYLPRRDGSPAAGATAGTRRSFHSEWFKSSRAKRRGQRSQACTCFTHLLSRRARDRHVRYTKRRRGGRGPELQIARNQVDSLEDLVEVGGD